MTYGRIILIPDSSQIVGGNNPDFTWDSTMGGIGGATARNWTITVPARATWLIVSGSAGGGGGGSGGPIGTPYGGGGGGSGESCFGVRLPIQGGTRISCAVGMGGQTGILNDGGPGFATTITQLDLPAIGGNYTMQDNTTFESTNIIFRLHGGGGGQGAQAAAPGNGGLAAGFRVNPTAPGYAVEIVRDGGGVYGGVAPRCFVNQFSDGGIVVSCGGQNGFPIGAAYPSPLNTQLTSELIGVTAGTETFADLFARHPASIAQPVYRNWYTAAAFPLYASGGVGGGNLFSIGGAPGRGDSGTNQTNYARPPFGRGGGGGGGGGSANSANDTIAGGYGGNGILILDFED